MTGKISPANSPAVISAESADRRHLSSAEKNWGAPAQAAIFASIWIIVIDPALPGFSPSVAVAALWALYAITSRRAREFIASRVISLYGLAIIAVWGSLVSSFSPEPSMLMIIATAKTGLLLIAFAGLAAFTRRSRVSPTTLEVLVVLAILSNAFVVLAEWHWPSILQFLESRLAKAGNSDYTYGVRFRGLANSGGAGGSLVGPIGAVLLLHLYAVKRISFALMLVGMVPLAASTMLTGRTGLVLFPIAIALFVAIPETRQTIQRARSGALRLVALGTFSLLAVLVLFAGLARVFQAVDGAEITNYRGGFIAGGVQSWEEEGTLEILKTYITTIPTDFPEVLTGNGFMGQIGTTGPPSYYTDSGLARLLLSVGLPLGFLYLLFALSLLKRPPCMSRKLHGSMLMLLCIAFLKEPLLMNGAGSRILLLLVAGYAISASGTPLPNSSLMRINDQPTLCPR